MLLKYQLDMEQASLSDEGLSEYLWPYPLDHMLPFRNNFTENLVTETRAMCGNNVEGSTGLLILLHHLFLDALRLFYCVHVVEGFSSLGRQVASPPRAYALSAIAEGKSPPPPEIYRILLNGPPKPKRWRAPFRLSRDYFMTEEITRRRIREPDYKSEIVAATLSPLTETHAKSIDERVTFRRPHVWFNEQPTGVGYGGTPRCVDTVLDILKSAFIHSGSAPPFWLDDYVSGWLGPGIAQVEGYLQNIESAPEYIPHHLWVGTGGEIWTRILRFATRRNHGHVTAHDHGCGAGQFQGEFHMNILEFESCDRFISFTEAQADGLRQHHLNPHFLIRDDTPIITSVTHQVHSNRHRTRTDVDPKTIMVVSNFYCGDLIVPSACISDVAYCDFEARLLAHLRDWGHKIIYKPRPLIGTRAPADFAARFDGHEENRPSETVLHNADVLILPSPTSTSFATALASKVPSVFIDFGMITHSDNARTALEKCCAIVPAPHGPNNRIVINWDLLRQAIANAPSLNDDTYVSLFHGHVV